MKRSFLDQFYTVDPVSGDYIIEIALKEYDDIFNTWDSSIYNIRDLDGSLKSFLEDCSYDIAPRKNIVLRFNMQNQTRNPLMEKKIETGIRNYFNYCLHLTRNKFSIKRKKTALYILVSFLFTVPSVYFQAINDHDVVSELVLLSLTVGGWVFLWEAFYQLFIQSSDLSKKKKQYRRIVNSPILFHY
ncbi:hypothetical protein SAMN05216389_106192 [Oceanobacillus limi]|uniref:Uncharacterized protein n=1 Tax=Oceanobacillus limi TaxID=930131 RepID=A0A1I0CGC5_9BACI|nr:hypothetical protein [Oceanobacillus limi]SET17994.1 hypothetical protein SAMN05216389_106192 [Oceanobacillus limi]